MRSTNVRLALCSICSITLVAGPNCERSRERPPSRPARWSGSSVVTITPTIPRAHFDRYRPYGFVKIGEADCHEGDTATYRFFNLDGGSSRSTSIFSRPTPTAHEFARAGFSSFRWVMPEVSRKGSRLSRRVLGRLSRVAADRWLHGEPLSRRLQGRTSSGTAITAVWRGTRAQSARRGRCEWPAPRAPRVSAARPYRRPAEGRGPDGRSCRFASISRGGHRSRGG